MTASVEAFQDSSADPSVEGFLHAANGIVSSGMVLTHGAGSDCRAPLLVAVAEALANAGITVLRCDLPFRQKRRFGPPGRGDAELDRAGLSRAIAVLRRLVRGPIFLGGHSYGGRQSSMFASENPDLVAGLLLLSYPLHPPGKPDQLRTQHFPKLRTHSLFVHGTRDAFGTTEEMGSALKLVPAKTELVMIEGAGHDLGAGKKSRHVAELILARFQLALLNSPSQT